MKKRIISLLTSLVMVISLVGVVPSMTVGAEETKPYYTYWSSDDGTVWIQEIYGIIDFTVPSTVANKPVSHVYISNDSLQSIKIPGTVQKVHLGNCKNLKKVELGHGVTDVNFRECSSLSQIELPNSIVNISDEAFSGCSSLKEIYIPASVKEIGERVFENCSSLEKIKINGALTEIPRRAFLGCTRLKTINLPYTIKTIGVDAFYHCTSLENIKLYNNVSLIEAGAFDGCSSLEEIILPETSLRTIEACAFYNCESLKSITIPKTVDSINNKALGFRDGRDGENSVMRIDDLIINCYSDTAVEKYADNNRLCYNLLDKEAFKYTVNDDGITITGYNGNPYNLVIPDKIKGKPVTSIGDSAFEWETTIRSLVLPNTLKYIGESAFLSTDIEGELIIPDSVTDIGMYAFATTNFTSVYIPDSVTDMKYSSFGALTKLENLTIKIKQDIYKSAFEYNWKFSIPENCIINCYYNRNSESFCQYLLKEGYKCGFFNVVKNFAFDRYGSDTIIEYFGADTNLTVPAIIDGKQVKEINFLNNTVKNVTLTNGIEEIGYLGDNVESINVPQSLLHGVNNNSTLKKVTFDNGITEIGEDFCSDLTNLETIVLPSSVIKIGRRAFSECTNLKNVIIPNGVKEIGAYAFDGCNKLKNVTIPASVEKLGVTGSNHIAFSPETSINVDSANKNYSSMDGVLYNKDKSILYRCPSTNNAITISNMTKIIGDNSFASCINLTDVTIPNGITNIGNGAFYKSGLKNVNISDTVTSIGELAFGNCSNLNEVVIPKNVTNIGEYAFGYNWTAWTDQAGGNGDFTKILNFKIKCYSGTAGEKYAKDNGFEYELLDKSHTHNYTSQITKQPTCTETGIKTYTCSCGDSYTETIAKTSHQYVNKVVKPTNNAQGYTLHTCSVCGYSYKDNYTNVKKPATVTGFKVTKTTANNVKLSWKKVSGAEGYIVYRYDSSKKGWKRIGKSKSGSICTATAVNLKAGTTYKFAIKAYKTVNGKELTSQKYPQLTTSTNPAKVSFKLSSKKGKSTIKWTKVKGATGYKLYYKTSKNGKWKTIATVKSNYSYYITSKAPKGKTCWFTVKAYRTVNKKTYNGAYTAKSMKVK